MAGAKEKNTFSSSCVADQQQQLLLGQQQQHHQQQQLPPYQSAGVQFQQQPSLLPSTQTHLQFPQRDTDSKELALSFNSYHHHRDHPQHIQPSRSSSMNPPQQQHFSNAGLTNSLSHQVRPHANDGDFSSSAFGAAPSENNNNKKTNNDEEEPSNKTQLRDFRSESANHGNGMPVTTTAATNGFPSHQLNSALRSQQSLTPRANESSFPNNSANSSSPSQLSQPLQNRFPPSHPFSHKNARHQVVPPNNHSPKTLLHVGHQLPSHNGNASFASPDEVQQSYQYNNDTGSGHDIQFGGVTVRHDSYGQPYLTNNYNTSVSNTRDHVSQPRQFSNAFSTSNNAESLPAKKPPTSTGLLSAFGSSTSVSAAAAVANIASLINASTSSTTSFSDISIQSPALSVPGVQRPTNVYGPMSAEGNKSMKSSQATAAVPPDMSERMLFLQRELEKERMMRVQLQQRVVELGQKVHTQQLVEKSYEDVAHKYKAILSQMQYMSIAIERYKAVAQQLEQERQRLSTENAALMAQKSTAVNDKTLRYNMLMERSKKLEEENSGLVLENETYQKQYEKCIDGISQQVVQALLTQKALQEQCMQMQDRLVELERENSEYYEAAVRQARQASSDSRLGWSYRRARTHASSPSADSVRSMPAQHLYWRQSSVTSLERHHGESAADKVVEGHSDPKMVDRNTASPVARGVSIETEFPANNGSPKSTRRLEKHPSSGSLDSAQHERGFVKYNGKHVRCQRSVSAEALRDVKVNMRIKPDLTLPKSSTLAAMSAIDPANIHTTRAEVHKTLSPESSVVGDLSPPANDPFADDADHILSKHQSLIVGSMEDLFTAAGSNVRNYVIQEEESGSNSAVSTQGREVVGVPTPPPRPHSRCLSESSLANEIRPSRHMHFSNANGESRESPPPLPPKQYKGSHRKYKPLPAEPPESDEADSSDKNTDSESIKQELNALTSQIAHLTSRSAFHS